MGCDYKLIQDLIITTSDLETYPIYYVGVIDRYYCWDESDYQFYEEKMSKEPESTILFERTGDTKKWHIDDISKIKDTIDEIKNSWWFTDFNKVIEIKSILRVQDNY